MALVVTTSIDDVLIIEPTVYADDRGFFLEAWSSHEFRETTGLDPTFVQDNHSRSARGVLRGLHYQIGTPQGKLVRVARGAIFDVAVDIRRTSSTFGEWVGAELSDENHHQLWIPEGFAHGFFVVSEIADVLYKATAHYAPQGDRTILWSDPGIGIEWPIGSIEPILSEKDMNAPLLRDAEVFE